METWKHQVCSVADSDDLPSELPEVECQGLKLFLQTQQVRLDIPGGEHLLKASDVMQRWTHPICSTGDSDNFAFELPKAECWGLRLFLLL